MAAILDATFRILADPAEPLTTTRVAERAGVSVGTLYQYFPDRDALVIGLLSDHLEHAVGAVERAAAASASLARADAVEQVVRAFLAAKAERIEVSRALARVVGAGQLDERAVVAAATRRARRAVATLLTAPDPPDDATELRAGVLCAALEGIVRAAVDEQPERLRDPRWIAHVVALAIAASA